MNINFLIFITIVFWGIGNVFYKVATNTTHPIVMQIIITALYIIVIPIIFFNLNIKFQTTIYGIIFSILGGACIMIGSLGFLFALQRGATGPVSAATSLYPAITFLFSYLFLNEVMNVNYSLPKSKSFLDRH